MSDERDWAGRRRAAPTAEELRSAREEMRRPIYIDQQEQRGYRCADCDHWFALAHFDKNRTGGRWLPRYGCPECGSKELVPCTAVRCNRCGGWVPYGDGAEHAEVCSE